AGDRGRAVHPHRAPVVPLVPDAVLRAGAPPRERVRQAAADGRRRPQRRRRGLLLCARGEGGGQGREGQRPEADGHGRAGEAGHGHHRGPAQAEHEGLGAHPAEPGHDASRGEGTQALGPDLPHPLQVHCRGLSRGSHQPGPGQILPWRSHEPRRR
ncbi:unnamed protein product, partial [Heterosigma akashiwo]